MTLPASRQSDGRRSQVTSADINEEVFGAGGLERTDEAVGSAGPIYFIPKWRRRNGMEKLLRNLMVYVARDEAGAELPEWTIWVAVLAVVGTALVTPVTTGLTTAFTTVLGSIPGVS